MNRQIFRFGLTFSANYCRFVSCRWPGFDPSLGLVQSEPAAFCWLAPITKNRSGGFACFVFWLPHLWRRRYLPRICWRLRPSRQLRRRSPLWRPAKPRLCTRRQSPRPASHGWLRSVCWVAFSGPPSAKVAVSIFRLPRFRPPRPFRPEFKFRENPPHLKRRGGFLFCGQYRASAHQGTRNAIRSTSSPRPAANTSPCHSLPRLCFCRSALERCAR